MLSFLSCCCRGTLFVQQIEDIGTTIMEIVKYIVVFSTFSCLVLLSSADESCNVPYVKYSLDCENEEQDVELNRFVIHQLVKTLEQKVADVEELHAIKEMYLKAKGKIFYSNHKMKFFPCFFQNILVGSLV